MKFNVELSIIFILHLLESLESKTAFIPPSSGTRHPSAIREQRHIDTLAEATKHVPEIVEKHVAHGHFAEGSKKSHNDEHRGDSSSKKMTKGLHHKSSKDSTSSKKGSDTKESHNKKYDEESGHDKKTEDEANESSFDEDGDRKVYDSQYKGANKHKVRKFEQGFFKSYHKKERNKKSKFFEDHHKGGDYKKYGQGKEKHYSTSSVKKAKKDGNTSSSSTFKDSKKKSKIK